MTDTAPTFLKPGVKPDPVPSAPPFIPRKLWQTTKDRNDINPRLASCISNLRDKNPSWEYTLFDDETQLEFLQAVCSDRFMRAYERIQPAYGAARADMFRYVLIYLHGGAYLDLKAGTERPLDQILRPEDHFIISQWDNGPNGLFPSIGMRKDIKHIPGGEVEQWFVVASPGHPFLRQVLEQVLHNVETYSPLKARHGVAGVFNVFGPNAYTKAIYPILDQYPHRRICAWHEGLRYTQLESIEAHRSLDKAHYELVELPPVTSKGLNGLPLLRYHFLEAVCWPYFALRRLNKARLRRRRARKSSGTN